MVIMDNTPGLGPGIASSSLAALISFYRFRLGEGVKMLSAAEFRKLTDEALDKKFHKVETVLNRAEDLIKIAALAGRDEINFVFTADETLYKVFEKAIVHFESLGFICVQCETRGSNVWNIHWPPVFLGTSVSKQTPSLGRPMAGYQTSTLRMRVRPSSWAFAKGN